MHRAHGWPRWQPRPALRNTSDGSIDIYQHRVSHDGLLAKEPSLAVDSGLVISRDSAGGWVRGKVSGRILEPSADWARRIPSDALRLQLDGRVTIETDEHEIIYMSYSGRMHCDKQAAGRFRIREALKAGGAILLALPHSKPNRRNIPG